MPASHISYYPMIKYVNLTIIRIIHINEHTIYVHIDFYNTANGYNGIFFNFISKLYIYNICNIQNLMPYKSLIPTKWDILQENMSYSKCK